MLSNPQPTAGALPPARIFNLEPAAYHKLPGLSPSLAHTLVTSCQEIARDKYERQLEGAPDAEDGEDGDGEDERSVDPQKQKRLDRGDVMHMMTLGVGKRIEVILSADLGKGGKYTTNRSKELRDAARAAGRIPVKEPDMAVYRRCIDAIRARLASAGHVLDGRSELAIEWWEPSAHGPVQCRTMIDHLVLLDADGLPSVTAVDGAPVALRPTFAKVYELKFPDDAHPDRSERTGDALGYRIAHAARLRALDALFPSLAGRIEYRFLFCETHRPYAFWDPTPTGSFTELGRREWRTAVNLWAAGLASGRWVGYHEDIMRRQIDLTRWRKLQEGFTDDE
jgi:hypothetical protein